jgi:predicted patatin/cPLA2 family phospholipase
MRLIGYTKRRKHKKMITWIIGLFNPVKALVRRSTKAFNAFTKTVTNLEKANDEINVVRAKMQGKIEAKVQAHKAKDQALVESHTTNTKMINKISSFLKD